MNTSNYKSIEKLLKGIEQDSRRSTSRFNRKFMFREWLIKLNIFLIRNTIKSQIEIDRRIVLLLSSEIFIKGSTTEGFQIKFYQFLDYCKATKKEEEFNHLIDLYKSTH